MIELKKKKMGIAELSNFYKIKQKCWKYDYKYLDFSFTCTTDDDEESPQCVVCSKILARERLPPNKLRWHFETMHWNFKDKDRKYFNLKAAELKQQQKSFSQNMSVSLNTLLALYKVAYHTISEELILPTSIDMDSIMVGENTAKKTPKYNSIQHHLVRRFEWENLQSRTRIKELWLCFTLAFFSSFPVERYTKIPFILSDESTYHIRQSKGCGHQSIHRYIYLYICIYIYIYI